MLYSPNEPALLGRRPTGKAVLNPFHPMAEKMTAVTVIERGVTPEFIGTKPSKMTLTAGDPSWIQTPNGVALTAAATSTEYQSARTYEGVGTGDLTLFSFLYIDEVNSQHSYLISLDAIAGINIRTSNVLQFFIGGILPGSTVMTANSTHCLVGRRAGGTRSVWVDGVQEASGANSTSVAAAPLNLLSFNGGFSAVNDRCVMIAGYSEMGWTDADIVAFSRNPHAPYGVPLFLDESLPIPAWQAAAAGGSVAPLAYHHRQQMMGA